MKVKHDANELNEGETMILTLADRRILDDKGALVEDPEELENVLVVCLCLALGACHDILVHRLTAQGLLDSACMCSKILYITHKLDEMKSIIRYFRFWSNDP